MPVKRAYSQLTQQPPAESYRRYYKRPRKARRYRQLRGLYIPKTYLFSRRCERFNQPGSNTNPAGVIGVTFQLTDLPANDDFTTLFDRFKIKEVQYRFYINKNPDWATSTQPVPTRVYPRLYWAHDFDDVTLPAVGSARAALFQYPNMKEFVFNESHFATPWFKIKPAILQVGFETTISSAYTPKWNEWIDMASPATPNYGMKIYYDSLQEGINLVMDCKFIVEMAGVR